MSWVVNVIVIKLMLMRCVTFVNVRHKSECVLCHKLAASTGPPVCRVVQCSVLPIKVLMFEVYETVATPVESSRTHGPTWSKFLF